MSSLAFRNDCICLQIVARPARENDDLKRVRLLAQNGSEPVHPGVIALNELIVQDECRPEVLGQRQPIQRRKLFTRPSGQTLGGSDRAAHDNTFGAELRSQPNAFLALLRQSLKLSGYRRRERLSKIAGLSRVGLLHVLQQESPGVVFGLEIALVALRQLVGFNRITQGFTCNRTSDLFERVLSLVDVASACSVNADTSASEWVDTIS